MSSAFSPPALTYPGDVRNDVLGQLMGPTYVDGGLREGEWVVAVAAEYDDQLNKTRVTFRYVRPDEMAGAVLDAGNVVRLPQHTPGGSDGSA